MNHIPSSRDAPEMLVAIEAFRKRCLIDQTSLCDDLAEPKSVWTLESSNELIAHLVHAPIQYQGGFLKRLSKQLSSASPEASQLMTELGWVYIAATVSVTPACKRKILSQIGFWNISRSRFPFSGLK